MTCPQQPGRQRGSRRNRGRGIARTTAIAAAIVGGEYTVVEGLPIDAFSQTCINKTLKELQDEQAGVAHLL